MKIAINGFGRIGRTFYRAIDGENVTLINDLGDVNNLKYLLKYDSVYGKYDKDISAEFTAKKDPREIDYKNAGIDLVMESTGFFTKREEALKHIEAGAKKVIITAPSDDADVTIIPGVNDQDYDPERHQVISMGSCTTNCIVPLVDVINKNFKIIKGSFTTTHSYTATQALVDKGIAEDWRRGRAAAENIVPTTTGAAKAIYQIFPELKGKIDALSVRIPTPTVSLVDFVCEVEKETTKEEVNTKFQEMAKNMNGALAVTQEQLVSTDLKADSHGAILAADLTKVTEKNLVHVIAWYDNEMGYSKRLVKLIELINK